MGDAYDKIRASFNAMAVSTYGLEGFGKSAPNVEMMRQAFSIVRRELGEIRSARIIEAGCGNAYWLAEIPTWTEWQGLRLRLEGFDLSDELIRVARQRPTPANCEMKLDVGNLVTYRPAEPADVVFCFDVIQHVPKPDRPAALRNMLAMVRGGGLVLVADNHKWAWAAIKNSVRKWLTRYTPIKLVPRGFLLASYPSFVWLEAMLGELGAEPVGSRIEHPDEAAAKRVVIFRRVNRVA